MDSPADFARDVWKAFSEQTESILGRTVPFTAPEIADTLSVPERAYVARLEAADGTTAFVVLALEPAIAAASLMAERPEADVKERVAAKTLEADDIDALGELFSQLAVPLTTAVEAHCGKGLSFSFSAGGHDGSVRPEGGGNLVVRMSCNPGGFGDGIMLVVVPDREGARKPVVPENASFDLSPEEIAALREATREAARGGITKALVIVAVERDQAHWKELLDKAGLPHEIACDVATALGRLRAGEFDAVIVDADSSPAGGLPTLAKIRAAASGVPSFIVASLPTRTHLIGCLAAGVRRYLTKPLDVQALMQDLGAG